jgi:biopolymer transport protein ExbD
MKRKFSNFRDKKSKDMEIDITSLLDILVILLVFLLKSYSASDYRPDIKNNLKMATSRLSKITTSAVTIQVGKDHKVWVEGKLIGKISRGGNVPHQIVKALEANKNVSKDEKIRKQKNREINFIFDKDLSYAVISKVMNTASEQGKRNFNFIVTSK